jgi:hypothetical protein
MWTESLSGTGEFIYPEAPFSGKPDSRLGKRVTPGDFLKKSPGGKPHHASHHPPDKP